MKHIDIKASLDSKLQISTLCSIRIHSRKRVIFEKTSVIILKVARAALEALRDLFRYLRKLLIGQLDAAVKVNLKAR